MSEKPKYSELTADTFKMGHIIAVKRTRRDFFGAIIERAQLKKGYAPSHACYTHVEISSGGYDSMRIMPPRAKAINIKEFYAGRYIKVLKLKDCEEFDNKLRYKIMGQYNLLCNKIYDFRGIFSFVFKFIKQDPNMFFCSEGVCASFQRQLPWAFCGIKSSKCFPSTIVSDKLMEVVWEGRVPKNK